MNKYGNLGVGNRGQSIVNTRSLRRHSEKSCYSKGNSGRDGILVQPEANP